MTSEQYFSLTRQIININHIFFCFDGAFELDYKKIEYAKVLALDPWS